MKLIQEGNVYDFPVPTYYVESVSELANVPAEAPAGTIVEVNAASGFKVFMKNTNGTFNEI